uniref:Ribonuclease H2 subunit B wHTH domain-containing protein n=1 Tax=Globodera rostochiensis TaxID=31243 RepID=A0A914HY48_GLORO
MFFVLNSLCQVRRKNRHLPKSSSPGRYSCSSKAQNKRRVNNVEEMEAEELSEDKMRQKSTAIEEELEDLVSLCGSVATTAGGDSLLDLGLDQDSIAVDQHQSDREFERKFFVMKEGSLSGKIYPLPHPASSERALYLLNENGELFELLQLDHGKRSFFYGDSVIGDGSVLMFFPVHPLFLVIEQLQRKASDRFLTAFDILEDEDFPALKELALSVKLLDTLKTVADCANDLTTNHESVKFRFNEGRLFEWLEERFRILKSSLAANDDENENCANDEHCFGILADYLPGSVSQRLKERLDIKSDRKGDVQQRKKRLLVEAAKEKETKIGCTPSKKKNTKLLAEASKGSRPIASFFGTPKAK